LRAAFETLNSIGIVALENAGYTQSDGWDDVNEIANRLNDSGKRPRAGVFYHGQDVARGRRGEGLMLTFGSYAARDADADSVGRAPHRRGPHIARVSAEVGRHALDAHPHRRVRVAIGPPNVMP
jgi:hypothetical protein